MYSMAKHECFAHVWGLAGTLRELAGVQRHARRPPPQCLQDDMLTAGVVATVAAAVALRTR